MRYHFFFFLPFLLQVAVHRLLELEETMIKESLHTDPLPFSSFPMLLLRISNIRIKRGIPLSRTLIIRSAFAVLGCFGIDTVLVL